MAKHEYIHAALICANLSRSVVINIHARYHIQDISLSNILQHDKFWMVPRLVKAKESVADFSIKVNYKPLLPASTSVRPGKNPPKKENEITIGWVAYRKDLLKDCCEWQISLLSIVPLSLGLMWRITKRKPACALFIYGINPVDALSIIYTTQDSFFVAKSANQGGQISLLAIVPPCHWDWCGEI